MKTNKINKTVKKIKSIGFSPVRSAKSPAEMRGFFVYRNFLFLLSPFPQPKNNPTSSGYFKHVSYFFVEYKIPPLFIVDTVVEKEFFNPVAHIKSL